MSIANNKAINDLIIQPTSFNTNYTTDFSQAVINKERSAPIGLFDSGVGGLSVYLHVAQQLPAERYIYYADTLHVPYGDRDSQDIEALTLIAVEWLYQKGCKLIVIACNSASAYALETARHCYPHLPIVGLVPALKPAVLASKSGHVAVLATKATLNGTLLNQVITDIAEPNQTKVTKYFDSQLVPWVEAGMPEDSDTAQRLRQQVTEFAQNGVDQLVLGCTHYPFFRPFLLQEISEQQLSMQVVDSGPAIAERVKGLLITNKLMAVPVGNTNIDSPNSDSLDFRPHLMFYASKYDDRLGMLVQRLLGKQVRLQYCF